MISSQSTSRSITRSMHDITIDKLIEEINKTDDSRIIYVQCFYNDYNISYRIMQNSKVYRYMVTETRVSIDNSYMDDLESELNSLWNNIEKLIIKTADKNRTIFERT